MKERELAFARKLYYELNAKHRKFNIIGDKFFLLTLISVLATAANISLLVILKESTTYLLILGSILLVFIILGYRLTVLAKKHRLSSKNNLLYRLSGTLLRLDLVRKYPFLSAEREALAKSLKALRMHNIFRTQTGKQRATGIASDRNNAIFFGKLHLFLGKLLSSVTQATPYAEMEKTQLVLLEVVKVIRKEHFSDKHVLRLLPSIPRKNTVEQTTSWMREKIGTRTGKAVLITIIAVGILSFVDPFSGLTTLEKNLSQLLTILALLQGSVWLLEFVENKPKG